ncbi:FadR/GntR family transcriptional regulator [Ramlibacter sp.]|uniref:FadR/GntR family transcriptional regulator n=1 Tax=Ramlibacter sp. TaxID=1917967 RepID=UPI002C7B5FC1|nr:FCD domain-containing protein [Ramlibacter sp.]HWI81481.1 FCD domain-containing protein [Ramlibacter sp.]
MTIHFNRVTSGARLSDQVAHQLAAEIAAGRLAAGAKLPPEARLVEQFEVSRTVVREAMSRLKSLGLVHSRQGSGVYVTAAPPYAPLNFDARHTASRAAVVQLAEVRRGLEAEAAAIAARRRAPADIERLQATVAALDRAVASGGDGVEQDLAFHRAIAQAAHNPFLIGTLDYLAQFMRGAIGVTRANEARRADFAAQVRREHAAVVTAIEAGDAAKARAAASRHMDNAIRRIEGADPAFWQQQGERLAGPLVQGPAS